MVFKRIVVAVAASGLLAAASVCSAGTAKAVAGETHRVATQPSAVARDAEGRSDLRVTVWYPARRGSIAKELTFGPPDAPVFRIASVAADAPFADDPPEHRRPVILLSHGFGGTARMMGWFGVAMAQAGYVVVSVDHPGNNGADRMTVPGAILWWERAEDLKRALAAVVADPVLGPHVDSDRVGAAGFSAGGFTVLTLAGARFDRQRLLDFCHAHPDDGICRPQKEFAITEDDMTRALQRPDVAALEAGAGQDHSLASVKAVYAIAPGLIQGMTPSSLKAIRVPVSIIAGDADTIVAVASNARTAAEQIPAAKLTILPKVGHYTFLSSCTEAGRRQVPLCENVGPQDSAHRVAIEQALKLFRKHLGKP
ncbi:MAG: alpha/beta hydrolase family protein [Lysobacter sp.]